MTLLSVEVGSFGDIGVTELLDGRMHRRVVVSGSLVDGEWVATDVSSDLPEVQAAAATAWTTEVVAAYRAMIEANYEPPVENQVTHLNNGGLVRFLGALPCTVYENIRIAGVTRVSTGRYRSYHAEAMPTDQYSVFASVFDASPRVIRVTARTTTYAEVRVTDLSGVAKDPTEVSIRTERVINT